MQLKARLVVMSAIFLLACLLTWPGLAEPANTPDIPPGTAIHVRMIDTLSSGKASAGDIFHGTLEEPIWVTGKQVYPKGADVTGTVVAVHPSGRLSEPGDLSLILNTISSGKTASSVRVEPLQIKGESHTKSNAGKIGGGAALGAVIGAIAGGGKGAAIGAGVGGAAGTAGAAATGKKEAVVESEAVLNFVTTHNVSPVIPVAENPAPEIPDQENAQGQARSAPPPTRPAPQPPERSAKANATDRSFDTAVLFTARDRRVIRNCLSEHSAELPDGTTQREQLPAGSERTVHVGGTLPNDLQRRAQPLPLACEEQLPHLPNDQERVVYSGRVLLLDESSHILDMFDLNESE